MASAAQSQRTITAQLNFAADRSDDGVWSNFTPEIRTQKLVAMPVEFTNARDLDTPPSLEREGFELHRLPLESYDWQDPDWIDQIYTPRSLAFVQELAGAAHVAPFSEHRALIRHCGDPDLPPAADFVHFDQTSDSVQPFLAKAATEDVRRHYPRVQLYNLWRVMTPPPQDVPLALCDQRTVDEADWVIGRTVEPQVPEGVPYTSCIFNPGQRWFFFSDLTPDDVIVFRQYDNKPGMPMGCLHGAFTYPEELSGAVPRVSIEQRIFAFTAE